VWRSLATFGGQCSLRTWVYRVAHNVAASHVMKQRRARPLVGLDEDLPEVTVDVDGTIDRQRALERLYALIQQLQPLDREVMLLYPRRCRRRIDRRDHGNLVRERGDEDSPDREADRQKWVRNELALAEPTRGIDTADCREGLKRWKEDAQNHIWVTRRHDLQRSRDRRNRGVPSEHHADDRRNSHIERFRISRL